MHNMIGPDHGQTAPAATGDMISTLKMLWASNSAISRLRVMSSARIATALGDQVLQQIQHGGVSSEAKS